MIRRVESDRFVIGEMNTDLCAIFKGTQLLQALGLLKRRRRQRDEMAKEVGAVSVKAEVPVGRQAVRWVATIGKRGPRKIKRVVVPVEGELDDVWIGNEIGVFHRARRGDHRNRIIKPHGMRQGIDELWIKERLISLDVDDVAGLGDLSGRFGDAVGSGRMIGSCLESSDADVVTERGNPVVVRGDIDFVEFLAS